MAKLGNLQIQKIKLDSVSLNIVARYYAIAYMSKSILPPFPMTWAMWELLKLLVPLYWFYSHPIMYSNLPNFLLYMRCSQYFPSLQREVISHFTHPFLPNLIYALSSMLEPQYLLRHPIPPWHPTCRAVASEHLLTHTITILAIIPFEEINFFNRGSTRPQIFIFLFFFFFFYLASKGMFNLLIFWRLFFFLLFFCKWNCTLNSDKCLNFFTILFH